MARVVQRLIGHARGDGPVADHGDAIAHRHPHLAPLRETKGGGDRGGRMRRPERVEFAFGSLGEPRQPPRLPQGGHAVAASGQDLVGIALVADVPDQLVARGVEHRMQRDGQFHNAQRRSEVPARLGHGADRLVPNLCRQGGQLRVRQPLQIDRRRDAVQKRGVAVGMCHGADPSGGKGVPCRDRHGTSFLSPTGREPGCGSRGPGPANGPNGRAGGDACRPRRLDQATSAVVSITSAP